MNTNLEKLNKGFWQVADPKIWVASTIPMVLGVVLSAAYDNGIHWQWLLLSFLGIYLIEIGKNAVNECVDYISGADPAVDKEHRTPFSGGKKTIISGLLTVKESAIIGLLTLLAAAAIGFLIVLFREPKVLYIGLAGIALAAAYSLPPFKLCYRGFGELAVGIAFGPLIVCGMYVVMSQQFDLLPLLVSLPIGFLITNVLWINQFPDYEADLTANKRNWVVRLGKESAVKAYAILFILAYASIIVITIYTQNFIWLIGLFTIPLALKAVKNCRENHHNIQKLIQSNTATVQIYILTGTFLSIAAIVDGLFL